jgi:hypothetical protein
VASSCENDSELSGHIKCRVFLDSLSDCQLLKKILLLGTSELYYLCDWDIRNYQPIVAGED